MWLTWERRGKCTGFWRESQKERDLLEDKGVDGRMGSEWILGRWAGECRVDTFGSGWGLVESSCKCGDDPACSGAVELVNSPVTYLKQK